MFLNPLVARAEVDYSPLCNDTNLRATMCGATIGADDDDGDKNGMCQPELKFALEAHCKTVVSLMTVASSFDANSSQVEQLIKNVADRSRRVLDSVVPKAQNNIELYDLIKSAVDDAATGVITRALSGSFASQDISPSKASDFLIEIMDFLRTIIKVSILPSPTFAKSCRGAVSNGAPRFMANAETCRVVSQVALDLVYNNAVALNGIYSKDPAKIAKGIIGLTNTTAEIWAKNIDLAADIGQTKDKVREREISTFVFDFSNQAFSPPNENESRPSYWSDWTQKDLGFAEFRDEFRYTCTDETTNWFRNSEYSTATFTGFFRNTFGLNHIDWADVINAECLKGYARWKKYAEEGRYEALYAALGRNDLEGYNELVSKWFKPERHAHLFRIWTLVSQSDDFMTTGPMASLPNYYSQAVEDGVVNGTVARALFGSGGAGNATLMGKVWFVLNDLNANSGSFFWFSGCVAELGITNASVPTLDQFAVCISRGLNLSTIGPANGEVRVYIGRYSGVSNYSEADAVLKAVGIRNIHPSDLAEEMSEADMIYYYGKFRNRLYWAMRLGQITAKHP